MVMGIETTCSVCGLAMRSCVLPAMCAICEAERRKEEKSQLSPLVQEQTPPQPSVGDCWLKVIEQMEQRRQFGIQKYGTPVQPFNGRDPLVDAFQEALDLTVYLMQAIEERRLREELKQ